MTSRAGPTRDALSFRIGASNHGFVLVRPTRREFPELHDLDDGNWVYADVEIAAGAFRGSFEANLRAGEFAVFRDQMRALEQRVSRRATFETMEEWLKIDVTGDGEGHFEARCEAVDAPGDGNHLVFEVTFDETELPAIVTQLDAVCAAFPERGRGTT